jgi:hypothetical protein
MELEVGAKTCTKIVGAFKNDDADGCAIGVTFLPCKGRAGSNRGPNVSR